MDRARKTVSSLKVLFLLLSAAMVVTTVAVSAKSDLFQAWPRLAREPWMAATLVDFYFNITILSAWALYREKKSAVAVLWILAFAALGSIATAFYVFLQLSKWRPGMPVSSILARPE
ncbi:MAG TPA: DUF1475 family protein [Candidatus Eisenbacteria bacterium]|nr:DUF1475 family protein [Candidatus Eisenbacteria bacterium]